ncbi:SEL1-like repeat protein [Roseinatronobacter monicus]|uniref:TPR repeat protein n=1 Tax=Roseinatronobacter monicus TaxID=393481 RepID=A0A543K4R9_9RHOB|nr:tetratricopeptide repeat protein [Roseinatronobacter monicus]TQM90068.1 TPR repeat protein [Roseinatronobacter monicus]
MRQSGLLVGALLFFMSGNATAQDAQRGIDAYRAGDFAEAYAQWLPLALAGDATWQFNIAVLYANGQGVARDPGTALEWFEAAANNGEQRAQIIMAEHYESFDFSARGMAQPRAIHWRRQAALSGHAISMAILARHLELGYPDGEGFFEDHDEATHWYDQALVHLEREIRENDDLEAMYQLAAILDRGPLSIESDRARAAQLFERYVAQTGSRAVMHNLGNIYRNSTAVRDLALSHHWYRRAGLAGLAFSQTEVAGMYFDGEGVAPDVEKALLWYVIGAQNNSGHRIFAIDEAIDALPAEDRALLQRRAERCIEQDYRDCGL